MQITPAFLQATTIVFFVIVTIFAVQSDAQGLSLPANTPTCKRIKAKSHIAIYPEKLVFTRHTKASNNGANDSISKTAFTDDIEGNPVNANWILQTAKIDGKSRVVISVRDANKADVIFEVVYLHHKTRKVVKVYYDSNFEDDKDSLCKRRLPKGIKIRDISTVTAYYKSDQDPKFGVNPRSSPQG